MSAFESLTDKDLIQIYKKAVYLKLEFLFIDLVLQELERRGLDIQESYVS